MKLLSLDVETTGLDPVQCRVIEIGAVLFEPEVTFTPGGGRSDPKWESFECLVKHDKLIGEPYALSRNHEILAEISGRKPTHLNILSENDAMSQLGQWLAANFVNTVTVVGKNFDRFDLQFLKRMDGFSLYVEPLLERRSLDVGSLMFNPSKRPKIPNLQECLEDLGIRTSIPHRALQDALLTATVCTRLFN